MIVKQVNCNLYHTFNHLLTVTLFLIGLGIKNSKGALLKQKNPIKKYFITKKNCVDLLLFI